MSKKVNKMFSSEVLSKEIKLYKVACVALLVAILILCYSLLKTQNSYFIKYKTGGNTSYKVWFNHADPQALSDQAISDAYYYFNVSPDNATMMYNRLMMHISPQYYQQAKKELFKKIDTIKAQGIAQNFVPDLSKIKVVNDTVYLNGTLYSYLSSEVIKNNITLELDYTINHGLIQIQKIKEGTYKNENE